MTDPSRDPRVPDESLSDIDERTDADLIARCAEGDERAWHELVERYGGLVHATIRRAGVHAADHDDVFQTVFAILFRRLGTLHDVQALPKWMITTTVRESWRAIRRRALQPGAQTLTEREATVPSSAAGVVQGSESAEVRAAVREALAGIGQRCRRLLELLFGSAHPPDYAAVSRLLGIPVGSIGPTRARCLAKLEKALRGTAEGRAALDSVE